MLTTTRQRFTLPTPAPSLAIIIPLQRCSLKASPNLSRGILPPSSAWHYSRALPRCSQMLVISQPEAWTHQQGLHACKEPAPHQCQHRVTLDKLWWAVTYPSRRLLLRASYFERKNTHPQNANLDTYDQVALHSHSKTAVASYLTRNNTQHTQHHK